MERPTITLLNTLQRVFCLPLSVVRLLRKTRNILQPFKGSLMCVSLADKLLVVISAWMNLDQDTQSSDNIPTISWLGKRVPEKPKPKTPTKLPSKPPTKPPKKLRSKLPAKKPTKIPTETPTNSRSVQPSAAKTSSSTKPTSTKTCNKLYSELLAQSRKFSLTEKREKSLIDRQGFSGSRIHVEKRSSPKSGRTCRGFSYAIVFCTLASRETL